jgi:hypothetical protein
MIRFIVCRKLIDDYTGPIYLLSQAEQADAVPAAKVWHRYLPNAVRLTTMVFDTYLKIEWCPSAF